MTARRLGSRRRRTLSAVLLCSAVFVIGCTMDFDQFEPANNEATTTNPDGGSSAMGTADASVNGGNSGQAGADSGSPNMNVTEGGADSGSGGTMPMTDSGTPPANTPDGSVAPQDASCASCPCLNACEATRTSCIDACTSGTCRKDCNDTAKVCADAC